MKPIVWSCGGGKQSAAIAALIIQGKLPRPDAIIMADTRRERSATWRYVAGVLQPALQAIGLEIQIARASEYATVDLFDKHGKLLIPAYTTQNGEIGKTRAFCSNEWKLFVVMRYLTAHGIRPCENWIGISTNEAHRMKDARVKWMSHVYPLCDLGISRQQCIEIAAKHGFPPAPKSTCYMCPNMSNATWREIRDDDPDDFQKAIDIEREARQRDPHIYLHKSGVTLDKAPLGVELPGLFDTCDSGYCHT